MKINQGILFDGSICLSTKTKEYTLSRFFPMLKTYAKLYKSCAMFIQQKRVFIIAIKYGAW